ncbi:MAG: hypothetical protein ABSA76_10615, partial [Bacteroidales bacterium]
MKNIIKSFAVIFVSLFSFTYCFGQKHFKMPPGDITLLKDIAPVAPDQDQVKSPTKNSTIFY